MCDEIEDVTWLTRASGLLGWEFPISPKTTRTNENPERAPSLRYLTCCYYAE